MADLEPNNPTGRTVGLATIATVSPGGGGQPELAVLLAEMEAVWRCTPRTRAALCAACEQVPF